MSTIIWALVVGIFFGALARLIMPGKQNISIIATLLLGAAGALAGSWLYTAISGTEDTAGIDWIAFFLGVVLAAVFIAVYVAVTNKKSTRT